MFCVNFFATKALVRAPFVKPPLITRQVKLPENWRKRTSLCQTCLMLEFICKFVTSLSKSYFVEAREMVLHSITGWGFFWQNSLPKALSKRFFSNNKLTKAFVIKIFLIKLVERGGNCVCLSYILPDNARQYFFFLFLLLLVSQESFPECFHCVAVFILPPFIYSWEI